MNDRTAYPKATQMAKKIQAHLKKWLLDCLHNIWNYWLGLHFLTKCLVLIGILMPLVTLPLALVFDNASNLFLQVVHVLAGISVFILGLEFLWFMIYMFKTPKRRRIFYLLMMALLWCGAELAPWLSDDPDIHQRFTIAAMVGSAWFCVPLFLSFFRPVYYYDD